MRSISRAASSGSCDGTRIEARKRGSLSSRSCSGPVVHGGAEGGRHVLVEQRDRAMQHVADREREPKDRARCGAGRRDAGGSAGVGSPVRARGERGRRRIAHQREFQPVDVALDELVAPVVVEMGQELLDRRRCRVDIAVDRVLERFHRNPSASLHRRIECDAHRFPERIECERRQQNGEARRIHLARARSRCSCRRAPACRPSSPPAAARRAKGRQGSPRRAARSRASASPARSPAELRSARCDGR